MRNSIPGVAAVVASCAIVCALLAGCTTTANPIPPGATDAEADAFVADELAQFWRDSIGPRLIADAIVPPPGVNLVAFTTRESWTTEQTSCLIAAGLSAREISGGFTIDDRGELDASAAMIAQWTCLRQYPVDPRLTGMLSDEQAMYMYDYFTSRLAPCLRSLGFDIPPAPERAGYAVSIRSLDFWDPYFDEDGGEIVSTSAEWSRVNFACPPLPDDPFGSYRPEQSRLVD